jgi:hypothetical protein
MGMDEALPRQRATVCVTVERECSYRARDWLNRCRDPNLKSSKSLVATRQKQWQEQNRLRRRAKGDLPKRSHLLLFKMLP